MMSWLALFLLSVPIDAGALLAPVQPVVLRSPDTEVIENLELLENFEGAADFELLKELNTP